MHRRRTFYWIYFIIAGSLLLRLSVIGFQSGDYVAFLSHWYDYFVQHGRWAALKDDFSSYPPLYLYLLSLSTWLPVPKLWAIKLISIAFDYVGAGFVYALVREHTGSSGGGPAAAGAFLFLPTVWFNSAVWGQCDGMYTAALLGCLFYLMRRRPGWAMVWFGIACSLKPQAIFFGPFLLGFWLREQFDWRLLFLVPLTYVLCGLPAMLAGRPVLDVLLHWFRQRNYPELTLGATNWYQWVSNDDYTIFYGTGLVLAMMAGVFLVLAMQQESGNDRGHWLALTALLSVLLTPYFLPGMHERYFYPADVLSLVYAFYWRRGWIVAVLVEGCSFFTYLPYLFKKEPIPRPLLAVVMTIAIGIVVSRLVRCIADVEPRAGGTAKSEVP